MKELLNIASPVNIRKRLTGAMVRAGAITIALALSVGVFTGSTSWASGVSVTSDSQAMANDAYSYPLAFDAAIQNAVIGLQASSDSTSLVSQNFYSAYASATNDYGVALLSAAEVYASTYQTDPAGAKNTYVDNFGHARATYFGALESARNTVVSEMPAGSDVARNTFINQYNSARDTYNNQLESIKNQIASL